MLILVIINKKALSIYNVCYIIIIFFTKTPIKKKKKKFVFEKIRLKRTYNNILYRIVIGIGNDKI